MLKPTDIENLQGKNSRYAVVIGVAKRAREIAEKAQEDGEILVDKTVSLAVNEMKEGRYKLMYADKNED